MVVAIGHLDALVSKDTMPQVSLLQRKFIAVVMRNVAKVQRQGDSAEASGESAASLIVEASVESRELEHLPSIDFASLSLS